MQRIVVLFNLKAGVAASEYEAWARRVDLPIVNRLGSIQRFDVFKCTALLGSTQSPPYAYVETVDVKDMDEFGKDIATEQMQQVAAEFARFADATFILTERLDDAA